MKTHLNLSRLLIALSLATSLSFSYSCTPVVAPVQVSIPARPALPPPLVAPDARGRVVGDDGGVAIGVFVDMETVEAIQSYVAALKERAAKIQVILEGHIEKLENRLKALGGK